MTTPSTVSAERILLPRTVSIAMTTTSRQRDPDDGHRHGGPPVSLISYRSASIGSRRDALNAGYMPKKMPTDAEKPMPMANDHHGSEIGKPETRWTAQPMPAPSAMPIRPPTEVRNAASIRNWNRISRAPRAERLAHADLARPLGDRDRHDRHHADAADHQRDRRDHDEREERALADLIPQLEERVLREQVEVVRLIELQAVADAHHALDVGDRVRLLDALARHERDLDRQERRAAADADRRSGRRCAGRRCTG